MSARRKTGAIPASGSGLGGPTLTGPLRIEANDLDDRQIRGTKLADAVELRKARFAIIDANTAIYWASNDQSRAYQITQETLNDRGTLTVVYRCSCRDFKKHGRIDCLHIFADRLRRKEVVVVGNLPNDRVKLATAPRRPTRKQLTADGRSHRTAQRIARQKMSARTRELVPMLASEYDLRHPPSATRARGGQKYSAPLRAAALLYKIVDGLSADAMIDQYERLINEGALRLRRPPCQNTLTEWMNDAELTPILHHFLAMTASPFRATEVSAIVDSSKVSQMSSAHSRWVEYEGDERDGADWIKCHAVIGAETSVVMGVIFSGTIGKGTHDINFFKPLVEHAMKTFDLRHVLADKAYLSGEIVGWLYRLGVKAVIPVKKKWDPETKGNNLIACQELVEWHDDRRTEFHEAFRFRAKIEALFSHLKRLADGYCWSRGRMREVSNAIKPCTAWMNELLCKFIFINLRMTITREEMTGVKANYLVSNRYFPAPAEQLIAA